MPGLASPRSSFSVEGRATTDSLLAVGYVATSIPRERRLYILVFQGPLVLPRLRTERCSVLLARILRFTS
jgi:hypothetical protein